MGISPEIRLLIEKALDEDLAGKTDVTTQRTVNADDFSRAAFVSRESGVLSGVDVAQEVFRIVDPALKLTEIVNNSDKVENCDKVFAVEGSSASILTAERTALNFLTHLSGIATLTSRYVREIEGTKAKIYDTRKTLPGLRTLQKAAVKDGGGENHRFGLYDAILIKDNHISAAGNIEKALNNANSDKNSSLNVEIEVDTLGQLAQVLEHGGADIVMLDNMDVATLRQAVAMVDKRLITEASGGVNLDTVRAIAETGVERISVGALTHSAPSLDIGLDFESS